MEIAINASICFKWKTYFYEHTETDVSASFYSIYFRDIRNSKKITWIGFNFSNLLSVENTEIFIEIKQMLELLQVFRIDNINMKKNLSLCALIDSIF